MIPAKSSIPAQYFHVQAEGAPTFRDFRQLRELELMVVWPASTNRVPLRSITSTELRKVTFRVRYVLNRATLAEGMEKWTSIDEQLCGLVDQLHARGYPHILEVELRFAKIVDYGGTHDPTNFLPKFRAKGIVTIIDASRSDLRTHSY